jgi:hypothetical protein
MSSPKLPIPPPEVLEGFVRNLDDLLDNPVAFFFSIDLAPADTFKLYKDKAILFTNLYREVKAEYKTARDSNSVRVSGFRTRLRLVKKVQNKLVAMCVMIKERM